MISALPSPPTLLDEDARRAFIEELTSNFCVSAGAGVGKTTAIVRRIANLALVRRREQPDLLSKLVVVTYGKLAAEELRVRTRDSILRHLDPGAIGRQTLLADLRSAFFGTIHSFCLKLIRDQGRFLGLPENVGLLEDRDNAVLWEKFCESEGFQALALPPALLERVSRHLTFDQLLELARQLGPDETDPPPGFDPEAAPPALNFSAALDDDGGRSKPKTREHQQHLQRWIEDFEGGAPFVKLPDYKGGSKTFLEAVAAAVQPYAHWLNDAASTLAAIIARAYRDHRLEKGLMTYRDQIYWCRRLVSEPLVLRRLRQRGYIVILDEAQDTDAEMFGILTEITRTMDAPPGAWPDDRHSPGPEPGRFCFVGDDQQAIYSERADLRVYRAYVDAYKAGSGGRHLEFSVTMRCPRRVIAAANAVFAAGRLPQPFVEFRQLNARPDCPEGAAWRLDLGSMPDGDGKASADARLARECAGLADFLEARGMEGLGITSWSEVAVICPRVSWLETAERIFAQHGLPGCLLSQKKIARELARHSWPAALLHVLIHPWDRFELIGVLREIFAVSDVDMARLHRFGDGRGNSGLQFWPAVPKERLRLLTKLSSHRLQHALELLHELRAALPIHPPMVGNTPLAGLAATPDNRALGTLSRYVDFVFERTALAARLETIGEPGKEAIRHLRVQAMQAECEGSTLRTWVGTLVASLEEATPMQAGAASAIQFLTGLKAKGLEWPVVIPLGLGRQLRQRTENYPRIERFEGQARVHFSNVTVDAVRGEARAQRQAEEFQRMLYVTLTRAKRLLIVPDGSGLHEGREPNMLQLGKWGELDREQLFTTVSVAGSEAPPASGDGAGHHQTTPRIFKPDARRLKRAAAVSCRIPQRVLPSGLVHESEGEKSAELFSCGTDIANPGADSDGDRLLALENTAPPGGTRDEPLAGIGGVDYGNWWHAVMQHYPWKAAHEAERRQYLNHERAKITNAAAWTSRAADELARFSTSAAHADFLRHGEVFLSEMPFSYPQQPELWIEGIMDLVIVTRPDAGGLWIVDWKTDRRWSSDTSEQAFLDRLAAKYAPQLQAYAEVFSKGFQRPVSRLLLYSTVLGKTVEVGQ